MVPDNVAPEWKKAVGSYWCQRFGPHCIDLDLDQPLHPFLFRLLLLVLSIRHLMMLLLPLHEGVPLLRTSGVVKLKVCPVIVALQELLGLILEIFEVLHSEHLLLVLLP